MKAFRLMGLAAIAVQSVWSLAAAGDAATNPDGIGAKATSLPPVLRPSEPPDSLQITLPGPQPVAPTVAPTVAPAAPPSTSATPRKAFVAPASLAPATSPVLPPPPPVRSTAAAPIAVAKVVPPVAKLDPAAVKPVEFIHRPAPVVSSPVPPKQPAPQMMGLEISVYCQKQIGHWKESDARKLLGPPKRQRAAYDENRAVNGTIFAFEDPSSKYKEVELDFDLKSGNLRTVFVYPPRLTWQECHRVWNGPVAVADAAQGRKFYSYTNRHLDVLVDKAGKVISLGWY
jgi:hypothetical protein